MGRKGQVSSQESRERDFVRQSEAKTKKYEEELLRKMRKAKKKEKEREKKEKQKEKEEEKFELELAGNEHLLLDAFADCQAIRPVPVKRPHQFSLLDRMLTSAPPKFRPLPATPRSASLSQILGMLAECLSNVAGPEVPVLSTAAAPTPGHASHLQILQKLAESISQITRESTSAPAGPTPTTGPASHQQILHKLAESIRQIVPPEEPMLGGDSMPAPTDEIIPPSVSARPTTQAFLQRRPNPKPFLQRRPNPKTFAAVVSTAQSAPAESLAHKQSDTVIPDGAVIAFVEEMERAHQYFMFQDYLRVQAYINCHSNPDDITCKLAKNFRSRETNNFSLLDMNDIWRSVKHYVLELRLKYWKRFNASEHNKDSDANRKIRNPVFYLLFQTRQKLHTLDENPRVELKKLQTLSPEFYQNSLVCRKPTLEPEARTVIVSNVSNDASEKDFWDLFCTSGDIEYLECQRSEEGEIACSITFKRKAGAKYAQDYMGLEVPQVCSKGKPLRVERKVVEDASRVQAVVKKAVDAESMLDKALDKYRELWLSYSKDVKINKKDS